MRPPAPRGGEPVPAALRTAAGYAWRLLVIALAVAAVLAALRRLGLVVVPVLAALFVTAVLDSPAGWLRRRGVAAWGAAALTLVGALVLMAGLGTLIVPAVVDRLSALDFNVQRGLERIQGYLVDILPLRRADLRGAVDGAVDTLQGELRELTRGLFGVAQTVGEVLAGAFIALFAVFFFLKDGQGFFLGFCRLFPAQRQPEIREMGDRAWTVLKRYLLGLAFVALVDSTLIAVALLIIGVPLVLPLAVITFFGAFFPFVGAVTAGLLAALVALVSGGLLDAVLVLAAIVLVQQIEGNLLYPVVVGRQVRLHPLAILLALTAGGLVAGILGAFLAVPVTAVIVTIIDYLRCQEAERSVAVASTPGG